MNKPRVNITHHLARRIYVQRHTPRKGIRPILDTVSRMRGRAMQFDTSQLGGVTNAMSRVTTLSSHNPHETQRAPTTIGHERPPPGSADDDEGPLTPTGPTTRIDKRPPGPTGGHDKRRTANRTINNSTALNIPASATSLERRERMHSNVLHGGNAEKTSDDGGESFQRWVSCRPCLPLD